MNLGGSTNTQHTEYICPFIWETALPLKSQLLRHIVAKSGGGRRETNPRIQVKGKGYRLSAVWRASSVSPRFYHRALSPAGVLLMLFLVLKLLLKQHMLKNEVLIMFL